MGFYASQEYQPIHDQSMNSSILSVTQKVQQKTPEFPLSLSFSFQWPPYSPPPYPEPPPARELGKPLAFDSSGA